MNGKFALLIMLRNFYLLINEGAIHQNRLKRFHCSFMKLQYEVKAFLLVTQFLKPDTQKTPEPHQICNTIC